jgi:tetratricopeptide (TPR) repeat protein
VRPPRLLSVAHRDKLASLYGQRATARQAQERFDEALADHGVAFALRQELALEFPSTTEHLLRLASSLHNIARTLQDAGRAAEALSWEEEALAAQRRVLRASPGNREAEQFLEYMLVGRCSLLLGLRRWAELPPAAAELQAGVVSNEGRLNSARVHAFLSLSLEDTDAAASTAALQAAAAHVADAVAHGFRDLAHFEKGPFAKSYARLVGLPAYDGALAKLRAARGAK